MWSYVYILGLLGQLSGCWGQVAQGPDHTTGILGGTVTLRCQMSDQQNPGIFEWQEYNSDNHGARIYASTDQEPEDPDKYQLQDQTNLVILDLKLYDGGKYGCKHYADSHFYEAMLVVLEEPTLILPELEENMPVNIECTANYGGPAPDDTPNILKPKLKLYVDGIKVGESSMAEIMGHPGSSNTYEASQLKLTKQYVFNERQHGKMISCEISTDADSMSQATEQTINVKYGVTNILISLENSFYTIGERVTCSAEGSPAPEYRWTAQVSPDPRTRTSAELEITADMVGQNQWTCTAYNNQGDSEVSKTISFEVLDSRSPSTGGGSTLRQIAVNWITALILVFLV